MHGRPSCSECTDALQRQRGCFKPGRSVAGSRAFRFTSPALRPEDRVLRECPVGRVLREAPWSYDLLRAAAYAEQEGIGMLRQSRYLQQIVGIVASEKQRLREIEEKQERARRDATVGAAAAGR